MSSEHALPSCPEPIDVVYTWVDGAAPGYPELLTRHANSALLYEGLATTVSRRDAYRDAGYAGLENFVPLTAAQLAFLWLRRPKMFCLNDNFDAYPNPRAVQLVRAFLEDLYPTASRFERA